MGGRLWGRRPSARCGPFVRRLAGVVTVAALTASAVPAAAAETPPASPSTLPSSTPTAPATIPSAAAPTTMVPVPSTSAPPTTPPPTTTTLPGASIVTAGPAPVTKIISIGPAVPDAPTTSAIPTAPPGKAAGPAASSPSPAPTRSLEPARGSPASPAPDQSPLLQLLAASEAALRQLDAQIAEAEAALAQRETELTAAQAALRAADSQLDQARAAVAAGAALVDPLDDMLAVLSAAEKIANAAAQLRTTPVGYPRPAGHSAQDDVARARAGLEHARRAREQGLAALQRASATIHAGEERVAEGRRLVASLTEEIEQRRNALANLRQQLATALAAGRTANTSVVHALTADASGVAPPTPLAISDIPAEYLDLYRRQAASCPGLSWAVLAAIGSIESAHGRSRAMGVHSGANAAGAMGPMQFLGQTWSAYGVDGNGDGTRDVYAPADAIAGAANYLCANGGGRLVSLTTAIWNYNHANWYVASVIELAGAYAGGRLEAQPGPVDPVRLVNNPNLTLSPAARGDILGGLVDQRVLGLLAAAATHHRVTVSVLKTGHHPYVRGTDRISNHYACDGCPGRGIDIVEVDGMAVHASNDAALELALTILTAQPPLRPNEFGSPWPDLERFPGGFTDGDHEDHLHLGWAL